MRAHVVAALFVLLVALPVHAEDHESSLAKLVSLGEQPLSRVTDLGGIIGGRSVDFTDGSDYFKTVLPPTIFPMQKSTPHVVLVVNLSLDIMHANYHLCMFNPRDIVTHRNDATVVPSVRVVYKDPRRPDKGILIHLTMSVQEHDKAPVILPAFAK